MERGFVGAENLLPCRYECKYLVSPEAATEIRRFIQPFMVPDAFARRRAGYRYPICSLYFDTIGLDLYRQTTAGEKNRFKLRVRSYSDDAAMPVFLEVKRRINDVILKRRAGLPRDVAIDMLTTGGSLGLEDSTSELLADLEFFTGHVTVASARPFLRVRYVREAYQSLGGDPLRITLDTDIAWLPTSTADFNLDASGWIPTTVQGTVLEIKFTDRYPGWVGEMIRIFDLQRQSVAKYALSVDSLFARRGEKSADAGRSSRPPAGWDGRPAWAQEV
jgi:VTC domain